MKEMYDDRSERSDDDRITDTKKENAGNDFEGMQDISEGGKNDEQVREAEKESNDRQEENTTKKEENACEQGQGNQEEIPLNRVEYQYQPPYYNPVDTSESHTTARKRTRKRSI